jgi:hypothetical protein
MILDFLQYLKAKADLWSKEFASKADSLEMSSRDIVLLFMKGEQSKLPSDLLKARYYSDAYTDCLHKFTTTFPKEEENWTEENYLYLLFEDSLAFFKSNPQFLTGLKYIKEDGRSLIESMGIPLDPKSLFPTLLLLSVVIYESRKQSPKQPEEAQVPEVPDE